MPKVSICIPTYNMARYVGKAVASALAQTFTDIEVIVCDNASTDETTAVLSGFTDPRIRVHRNETNIGAIGNFNLVCRLAAAPWIKFLEADDMLESTCVKRAMDVAESDPDIGIVSVGRMRMDAKERPLMREVHAETEVVAGEVIRRRVHRRGNEIGTPSEVMIHRRVLESAGGFDPEYGSYLNDWDLWIRCYEGCGKVGFVAETLAKVRSHSEQIGAVGMTGNSDIGVMYLMLRKRWAGARFPSWLWYQRQWLTIKATEDFVVRGLERFARLGPFSNAAWDTFRRIYRELGAGWFLLTVTFSFIDLPAYWCRRLRYRRRVRPLEAQGAS